MSTSPSFRCFDYVNRPYAVVERALANDPIPVLVRGAAGEGSSEATLHVGLGPIDVGTGIVLELRSLERRPETEGDPRTTFTLSWRAAKASGAFPEMDADLVVYPLSASETQLELVCRYQPPLGIVGKAIDAVGMHRVAETSVEGFLKEVAAHLRKVLPQAEPASPLVAVSER